jgi:hypothetical protein
LDDVSAARAPGRRSGPHPAAGNVPIPQASPMAAGDVRHDQVWYRKAAASCTPDPFNLTNGVTVIWTP